ncbi:MAG: acyltransferase [Hyphomonadaceae bacterium]|nr:acyltransferase [Hyphomonadaceae bacterium]
MSEAKSPPSAAGRDQGLDVARGLLMAWIIIVIHGTFWLGILPRGPGSLLLFEMPPIFLITGAAYFLGEGARHGRLQAGNYADFLMRRGVRIYLPYAVYVIAAAILVTIVKWDGALSAEQGVARLWAWLNPVTRGAGHTWKMLSWHLWFVAPFLIVTALMPLITTKRMPAFVRPWMLAAAALAVVLAIGQVTFTAPLDDQLIKNTIFYAFWAAFGFMLAAAPKRWRIGDYALVLALSLAGMFAAAWLQPAAVTLDMQHNKFPPNAMFFLFSCVWVAVLLIGSRLFSAKAIDALAASPLLKPFMSAGYSIYLWQGIGYSLAAYAGGALGLNVYVIWIAAIALTIGLGLVFAPLERIRLPKRRTG